MAVHITLGQVHVQLAIDIAGKSALRRVSADREHRCAGWDKGGAAVDQWETGVAMIVECRHGASNVRDDLAQVGRPNAHGRAKPGDVLPAVELEEVDPFDHDDAAVWQQPPDRAFRLVSWANLPGTYRERARDSLTRCRRSAGGQCENSATGEPYVANDSLHRPCTPAR